jgi:virginiamycin B lyase
MIRRSSLLACFLAAGCSAAGVTPGPLAVPSLTAAAGKPHAITEFAIAERTMPNPVPYQIVAGPDGAMWFTEEGASAIGRIDARGRIRQFPLRSKNAQPEGIALGPDGALYVAENEGPNQYETHLARVSTDGRVREWGDSNLMPEGVAGADGRMWFTQGCGGLAVLSRAGNIQRFPLQGIPSETNAIVEGPDGAIWFAEDGTATIGRISNSGAVTLYGGLRYEKKYADLPHGVAVGSDGNLWWTALESGVIWATDLHGRIVHAYAIPTNLSQPWGIVAGPDGALWFTEYGAGKIGRVTTAGAFTEYTVPTPNAKPQGLAFAADGKLWFVESGTNRIGRIEP